MQTKAHMKATNKWQAENKDRIVTLVPAGRKAELKALAAAQGKSLNQYVVDAIDAAEGKSEDVSNNHENSLERKSLDEQA